MRARRGASTAEGAGPQGTQGRPENAEPGSESGVRDLQSAEIRAKDATGGAGVLQGHASNRAEKLQLRGTEADWITTTAMQAFTSVQLQGGRYAGVYT